MRPRRLTASRPAAWLRKIRRNFCRTIRTTRSASARWWMAIAPTARATSPALSRRRRCTRTAPTRRTWTWRPARTCCRPICTRSRRPVSATTRTTTTFIRRTRLTKADYRRGGGDPPTASSRRRRLRDLAGAVLFFECRGRPRGHGIDRRAAAVFCAAPFAWKNSYVSTADPNATFEDPQIQKAMTALREGRPQAAEQLLRKFLESQPDNVTAMTLLAETVMRFDRHQE